jgi:hypothetical protein
MGVFVDIALTLMFMVMPNGMLLLGIWNLRSG